MNPDNGNAPEKDPELAALEAEFNKPSELMPEPTVVVADVEPTDDADKIARLESQISDLTTLVENMHKMRAEDTGMNAANFQKALIEALKVSIPAATIGVTQAQHGANQKALEQQIRAKRARLERCEICRQPVSACGGAYELDAEGNKIGEKDERGQVKPNPKLNHIMAYVGPRNHRLFKWYQGQIVNGVRYLSDRPGHAIPIPKKSDILTGVNTWENDQEDLLQGRSAEGRGSMGFVGPGQSINKMDSQAYLGWR